MEQEPDGADPAARGRQRPRPPGPVRRRPDGATGELVEAIGRVSEGFEYLERARGHLYALHQLIGRADILFEEAADLLDRAGHRGESDDIRTDVVGRNVLDGRWTFQIVEEFDDLYYEPIRDHLRGLEARHLGGVRHLYESEMKERRRSADRPGHEVRPPAAHTEGVETDLDRPAS